jgi:integrase
MIETRGSIYRTRTGYGIRWQKDRRRAQRAGFATKSEARVWLADHLAAERRGAPTSELSFHDFAEVFLERHGATVSERTKETLAERLAPARSAFGVWTLRELELAADDVAAWRASLAPSSRYRLTAAFRQALAAAVRWRYMARNPAVDAGRNPQPRLEELRPFTLAEVDALSLELGPVFGPLVVFAAETGLRTNEWIALERRDVDRAGRAIVVQRRFAGGLLTPYPKTERSRRRVPLTARALAAVEAFPPRLATPLLFPAARGGHIGLDTWRSREWYPAIEAAGLERRGPYALRHTFATEALAAGVSTFQVARLMGTSVAMIDRTYGHLARDSEDSIRARLEARGAVEVPSQGEADAELYGENPLAVRFPRDGAYRDRTGDLRLAKPALSQLS